MGLREHKKEFRSVPHIREMIEIRFYVPGQEPSDAVAISDEDATTWRKYHVAKQSNPSAGYRDGWVEDYGPTPERTVAVRVYEIYCECDDCVDWRARGRPRAEQENPSEMLARENREHLEAESSRSLLALEKIDSGRCLMPGEDDDRPKRPNRSGR